MLLQEINDSFFDQPINLAPKPSSDSPLHKKKCPESFHQFDDDLEYESTSLSESEFTAKNEFDEYIRMPLASDEKNSFVFWRKYSDRFPRLSKLACRILALPASSASAERIFSRLKRIATDDKFNLSDDTVEKLIIGNSLSQF